MAQQISLLVIQLGFIIFAARFFGMLASKFKIPSVMGELLAGIIFGPYCLGGIGISALGLGKGLFPLCTDVPGISIDPKLYAIATLGSIILLFISGLETDVRTFFKYSVVGTIVGIGGIVCSFLCGAAVGVFVLGWAFMDPRCLFLGILCTATSVGISARILSEHHAMDTPEGVTIMAAAVIDDVLGIVCLAIVIGIANVELNGGEMAWGSIIAITLKSFGIWLGVTAIGLVFSTQLGRFLKIFKTPSIFAVMAFGFALVLAGLFEKAGLAMIVGAFVMGLSFSKTDLAFKIRSHLTPIYNFLVPIFFVVMGMLVDVRVLRDPKVLLVGIIFTAMAIAGKIIGCSVPAFAMNFNAVGSLRVGIGMIPRCEVVLIIAGIAATTMMKNPALATAGPDSNLPGQVPIFDGRLFGIAIIMPLITALLAPPLLNMVLAIKKKGVRKEVKDSSIVTTRFTFQSEAIAHSVLHAVIDLLHHDGFSSSAFSTGITLIHFRRENTSLTLQIEQGEGNQKGMTKFIFNSDAAEVNLIKTAVYESVVELHQTLSELKKLATPENLKEEIDRDNPTLPNEKPQEIQHIQDLSLDKMLTPNKVIVDLQASTKEEAIRILVNKINESTPLTNAEECISDILEREETASTLQEEGIAMPHARTNGTNILTAAIGINKNGFEYDKGEMANIVVLSICPKEETSPYLLFISQLALILSDNEKHQQILSAQTAEEAVEFMLNN